jgi:hypothetical protein
MEVIVGHYLRSEHRITHFIFPVNVRQKFAFVPPPPIISPLISLVLELKLEPALVED